MKKWEFAEGEIRVAMKLSENDMRVLAAGVLLRGERGNWEAVREGDRLEIACENFAMNVYVDWSKYAA